MKSAVAESNGSVGHIIDLYTAALDRLLFFFFIATSYEGGGNSGTWTDVRQDSRGPSGYNSPYEGGGTDSCDITVVL